MNKKSKNNRTTSYIKHPFSENKELLKSMSKQAQAINLNMGQESGLNAHYEEQGQYYQITRHNELVYDCRDIVDLINITFAIARFINVGEQHQKVA